MKFPRRRIAESLTKRTATLRKASLPELLRIIREEEAMPMNARLAAMGENALRTAENRRSDPSSLRRL